MPDESNPTMIDSWLQIWQMGILQFREWLNFMGPFTVGGMFNTVNISSKSSADPEIEKDVTRNVASYGRQLGRISDALLVVLDQANLGALGYEQQKAVAEFRELAGKIAAVKMVHEAKRLGIPITDLTTAGAAGNGHPADAPAVPPRISEPARAAAKTKPAVKPGRRGRAR